MNVWKSGKLISCICKDNWLLNEIKQQNQEKLNCMMVIIERYTNDAIVRDFGPSKHRIINNLLTKLQHCASHSYSYFMSHSHCGFFSYNYNL